jgi:hypothetical protein
MKSCSKCLRELPLSEFNKKGENKYQPYCRPCDNAKARERYANNRESHVKVIGERNRRYRDEIRAWIRDLKESSPCSDCGIFYSWYVMDFDHVRGEKFGDISNLMVRLVSRKKLQEEIDKCELVCSNCHRIRTHTRRESK